MCSICGMVDFSGWKLDPAVADAMGLTMKNRGPDQSGLFVGDGAVFQHNRLAIIDIARGLQPMTRVYQGRAYTIVYNGELYNTPELTALLRERGVAPETYCDTEVVLYMYILFGRECAARLNGIFAFAVYDAARREVYLARDRFGVKPLFYTQVGTTLLFASEIKALLRHTAVRPDVDRYGLAQLLYLAPVRLNGSGVFKDIYELCPVCQAVYDRDGLNVGPYWRLVAAPCRDSRATVLETTRCLLEDAIRRQLVSDVPLCTLLSGGLDSSLISAVAAAHYRRRGERLATYSFEYEGNKENFHSSLFQPQSDDEYAAYLADYLGSGHHVLNAPTSAVAGCLAEATLARDLPGQADIDSSLLYYCRLIKERHSVAISGECADEIFGGYPWFYQPEMLSQQFFPWVHDPQLRVSLFDPAFTRGGEGYEYLRDQYQREVASCPVAEDDSAAMRQSRVATWLSVNYFMTSLLERKDRMSMASAVEVRVPFADHRILEYVFNVPWEIKFEGGVEKALLRESMREWLPEKILRRKKSPYPKTQNPAYETAVRGLLQERLARQGSPLSQLLDRQALRRFVQSEGNATWFGQLMSKPQLLAWLVQFDIWAEEYKVNFI